MPSRRLLLTGAGSLALPFSVASAVAAVRPHRAAKAPPPSAAADVVPGPTGSAADTPVGPLDTEARWALISDFQTNAVLLQKAADERMRASLVTKRRTA